MDDLPEAVPTGQPANSVLLQLLSPLDQGKHTMALPPGSLYKPPVHGSIRRRGGLTNPPPVEILYEWVLRTIGKADSQGEIRRRIFNGANCPPLGEAVPRARQCLEENNQPDVARLIPEHDRRRNPEGPWKTFTKAADFDQIKLELQQAGQAAGTTQVFSPHELLSRPRDAI